jgi:DNA primase
MKKATINYFDTLTSVLQQGLLELHTLDNDKYNLFLSMAQFADTLGQKFLDLDPHHLTNIMDITINGILPTENE